MTDPSEVSATEASYDATAEVYSEMVGTHISGATETVEDQALLAAFVASVANCASGPVADVGCGPGRVARFVSDRGADVIGVDVSLAMLAVARKAHPQIPFVQGRHGALPFPKGSLRAVVCWYSITHTPPPHLNPVGADLVRVLAPGGSALVAFQAGEGEPVHRSDAYGTHISLTSYRHSPDDVIRRLKSAGFELVAFTIREPELAHETTPQAFVVVRSIIPSR